MDNNDKESQALLFVGIACGVMIGFLAGMWITSISETNNFQTRCIEAGVGYYDSKTAEFKFIEVK